jgi:hypothetical protein
VAGLSTRNYRRAVESVVEGYGIEKSSVSRQFVETSSNHLREPVRATIGRPESGGADDRWQASRRCRGGTQRKALARRKSAAAQDRHRTFGSRKEIPPHQRLPRNSVAEGTPESRRHSAEGGPHRRSPLNLIRVRLTVPNIESRCNQLKLGHPRAGSSNR